MTQNYDNDMDEVNRYAEMIGIPCTVRISPELKSLLKPNEFLSGLGIRYAERLEAVLGLLKGSMAPEKYGAEDTLSKYGAALNFAIAKGPYIREEPITIKAELKNDGGNREILLTAILKDE